MASSICSCVSSCTVPQMTEKTLHHSASYKCKSAHEQTCIGLHTCRHSSQHDSLPVVVPTHLAVMRLMHVLADLQCISTTKAPLSGLDCPDKSYRIGVNLTVVLPWQLALEGDTLECYAMGMGLADSTFACPFHGVMQGTSVQGQSSPVCYF